MLFIFLLNKKLHVDEIKSIICSARESTSFEDFKNCQKKINAEFLMRGKLPLKLLKTKKLNNGRSALKKIHA